MVTPPVAFAPRRRQHQASEAAVGTGQKSSTTSSALWVLGLLTASAAITVASCVPPPPGLDKNAYFLAISCFFFAGIAGVMSAVCMTDTTHLRHRHATGRKLMHVLLARLGSVGGGTASFSTTTTLWVLGLLTASAAITAAACVPPPPGLHKNAYFLAISCFFFAGVAGIMATVCMAADTHLRDRDTADTTWKKVVMHVLLARRLVASVGGAFSTTTGALGVLGLAAASTAINLLQQSVRQPHQQPPRDLDERDYYYHLAISAVFFAGVAAIMAAVTEGGQVAK